MTIAWDQRSGTSPVLYYDVIDHGQNINNYISTQRPNHQVRFRGMHNHFVRLKNLQPNTHYYFVIEDSEGLSPRFFFQTGASHAGQTISAIAGGDSRNLRTARKNANLMVAKLRADVVFFGGDMTGGDNDTQWPQWMDDWQLTIASDGRMTPIVGARGNHEKENATLINLFDAPHPDVYYALNFGGNLLRAYTLNSLISTGGEQAAWLENDLSNYSDVVWKIAQYHQGIRPHTKRKAERSDILKNWAHTFYKHRVDVVVECDAHVVKTTWPIRPSTEPGSDQGFVRDNENGTVYVGEGCWGAPLRADDDDKSWTRNSGSFNQFKWLFISQEKIEIRTIKTDNAQQVGSVSDHDRLAMPYNIDLWRPSNGSVITIKNKQYIPGMALVNAAPKASPMIPSRPKVNELKDFELLLSKRSKVEVKLLALFQSQKGHFELQRSSNGLFYRTIDTLQIDRPQHLTQVLRYQDKEIAFLNVPKAYYRLRYFIKDKEIKTEPKVVELTPWNEFYVLKTIPDSEIVQVNYQLNQPQDVRLKVYNDFGQTVISKRLENKTSGSHVEKLNLEGWDSGIYLLSLETENEQIVRRIIVPSS